MNIILMRGLITTVRQVFRALRSRIRLIFMPDVSKGASFEEIMTEVVTELEKLQERQRRVIERLRDAAERKGGIDDMRSRIKDL